MLPLKLTQHVVCEVERGNYCWYDISEDKYKGVLVWNPFRKL